MVISRLLPILGDLGVVTVAIAAVVMILLDAIFGGILGLIIGA